jgi:cytochrome c oxidase subunit II
MDVQRYERIFLSLGAGLLVIFLAALAYAAVGMGIHLPGHAGGVDPRTVRQTPPFDSPGVRQLAPGRYEVVLIGHAWAYEPNEIHVPAGAEVRFRATSADVIHGFLIEGTRLNAMLIPGEITELDYRFENRGEHLLICHEYCGVGHHLMFGKVVVE